MEGDIHGYDYPATIAILDFQSRVLAVELLQACPRVRQTDALVLRRIAGPKPRSIILHPKFHRAIDLRRADQNAACGGASSNAMANGVFYDGLQD